MIEVVGIGAEGVAGLAPALRAVLDGAEVVVGGSRHLAMLPERPDQERRSWPSPLRDGLSGLLDELAGRRVVVLASGDPLVSGIGTTLVTSLGADAVRIHPAVSSVALARARMRWAAEESDVVTLVGRDVDRLRRWLSPGARLIVLTSGADAPSRLAGLLVEEGYAAGLLTVLGDLGGSAESRVDGAAGSWAEGSVSVDVPALHLVCIECPPAAEVLGGGRSLVPGLRDDAFEHDGQLTKRLVRAAALAHLAPRPGEVMWDLGAGAGSVGIEVARQHPRITVCAVERSPERAARIRGNAARLGVPDLTVVEGASAVVITELPSPDMVFIGGGASAELLDAVWSRIRPAGRLVVHGVTVETEALVLDAWRTHGGSVSRIAVEELEPIGSLHGWRPARAIVQWSVTKLSSTPHRPEEAS